MIKKIISMALFALLINLAIAPSAFASDNAEKDARLAAKVKTSIAKLGTGSEAKVKLKLKDGTKIKGYITQISEDQFVVMNTATGQTVPVLYPSVKQVKGNNLSTGAFIAIAVGVAILFIIFAASQLK